MFLRCTPFFINQMHLSQSKGWMRLDGATLVPSCYFFPSLNICLYPNEERVGKRSRWVGESRRKGVSRLLKNPLVLGTA